MYRLHLNAKKRHLNADGPPLSDSAACFSMVLHDLEAPPSEFRSGIPAGIADVDVKLFWNDSIHPAGGSVNVKYGKKPFSSKAFSFTEDAYVYSLREQSSAKGN